MATGAVVIVYDIGKDPKPIIVIYSHYDGYPQDFGASVVDVLKTSNTLHGTNKAAARLVAKLFNLERYSLSLFRTDDYPSVDYIYEIKEDYNKGDPKLIVTVTEVGNLNIYETDVRFYDYIECIKTHKGAQDA